MQHLLLIMLLAISGSSNAQESVFEEREFDSTEQERTYRSLINELRCLVCQNQSIADSNADLAAQLRGEVHTMLRDGRSKEDVTEFMVARYGDYVLFSPPVTEATALLWFGPFALLGLALFYLLRLIKARGKSNA